LDIPLGEIGSRWIAGSEHKVYGKVASLFSQPYVTPPGNDTAELSPQQIILLAQSSAIQEFERGKHSKVTACRDEPRQQVRASDMRMMKMHYGFQSVQSDCNCICSWRHTAVLQVTERTKRR
jgi:hypothetical protein